MGRRLPSLRLGAWLHPTFATVDPTGLDVDTARTDDGGLLICLRVDPGAMADADACAGRDVIEELIRRTVMADGRRLVDVNPRLDQMRPSNSA